ncbi:uncharacterized protein Z520_12093 [Fonsecaea multimorphosa CBS 102226]|uniref:C2H2-type domain-containing protein n=1 Tax=Fonsecaea multimorphosa CBS 102226 TaxID=1442371 RepID=A0A0D2JGC3_9EURO|nr:uncharacterized protein Z520_12093 [Fonsecaea multimorphosa CBS 102226]KIX92212.1 hypothetical protein Z520_12093 [Fonsecaea multimorphosa CBS 102226]
MQFECAFCDKAYNHRKTLNRHVRDKHPEQTGGQSSDPSSAVVVSGVPVQGLAVVASPAVAAPVAAPVVAPAPLPLFSSALPSSYPPLSSSSSSSPSPPPVADNQRQLRSSRSTRNQDNNPTPRNRAGLADFDVTEGLPVQRYERRSVTINQDASADQADGNNQSAENNDSNNTWAELPLPSFWPQLSPVNQELVRRARAPNPNAKLSIWDRKTSSWIPGIELERREAARKAQLNKAKHSSAANVDAMNVDDEEDKNDEDNDDLMDVEGLAPDAKRRKATSGSNERVFEVKRWERVPVAVAEKMPEPKYLADRRPGMESLYKGAYKATNGFGTIGDAVAAAMSGGATGFDLGDGAGLGNASAILAPGSGSGVHNPQADGTSTPVRKNMPPRRKKKKLGGPGRKPKNPNPEPAAAAAISAAATEDTAAASTVGDVTMRNTPETAVEGADNANGTPAIQGDALMQDADGEGSGSESEGEGSEEGEISAAIDPALTANTTVVDLTLTEHTPVIDPALSDHTPVIDPALSDHTPIIDPALSEHTPIIDPAISENTPTIDPALTEDPLATQITPKPVEEAALPQIDGASEEHMKEEDTEKKEDVAATEPADSPEKPEAEADADANHPGLGANADAVSAPVIEQEAKMKEHEEGGGEGDEMDVLGALEAAVDKETNEDA